MPHPDQSSKEVPRHTLTPQLKAVAMTGGLSRAEMAQALEADSAEFLLKPFDAAVLLETVRRALRA